MSNNVAFVHSFGNTRPMTTFQPFIVGSSPRYNNYNHCRQRESSCYHAIISQRRRLSTNMLSTHDAPFNDDDEQQGTIDLPQIKKGITRLLLRTHKKFGKVSARMDAARQDQSFSELSVEELGQELNELQSRLQRLNWLEDQWNNVPSLKKKTSLTSWQELMALLPENDTGRNMVQYIRELEIDDNEVARNKRIEEDVRNKKSKKEMSFQRQQQLQQTQRDGGRLPYRRYYSENQTEIRVSTGFLSHDLNMYDCFFSFHTVLNLYTITYCYHHHHHHHDRSENKQPTMTFSPSPHNIALPPTGGTTPPAVPAHTSSFAQTHPLHPTKTYATLPLSPHSKANAPINR